MTCPAPERLAAAASGEDDAILDHAADCVHCGILLDDQRELRTLLGQTPAIALTRGRREELAAEIMAHTDHGPRRSRATRWIGLSAVLAAAAGITLALVGRNEHADAPPIAGGSDSEIVELRSMAEMHEVLPDEPRVEPLANARVDGAAEFARDSRGDRDVVQLAGGELRVDATRTRSVQVIAGDTAVGVKQARVTVVAKHGVIASVHVFAGSAEVTVAGHRQIIETGMVWERDAVRDAALAAFRTGWEALRDKRTADAIAAFDRATDPIVAEDAAYWAAIASERAGNLPNARRRYADFLARFAMSPRVTEVQAALARLDH
jgi:hypothetical protein